ncbi:hypothetical protein AL714_19395, partial [Clostridium botulinum]
MSAAVQCGDRSAAQIETLGSLPSPQLSSPILGEARSSPLSSVASIHGQSSRSAARQSALS